MSTSVSPARRLFLAVLACSLLAGCAGLPLPPPSPRGEGPAGKAVAADPFSALAERHEENARAREEAGDLRGALESWRIVSSLRPGDTVPSREVSRLAASLSAVAEEHFRRGVSFLRDGSAPRARKEFLLALAADPSHGEALDYLKNRMEADTFPYLVEEGDTLESIAASVYGDPELAVLIARVNDLDEGAVPRRGRELILPFPEEGTGAEEPPTPPPPMPAPPAVPPEEPGESPSQMRLAKARGYLEAGNFQDALTAATGIPAEAPEAKAARAIIDAAYYGDAMKMGREGNFVAALASLRKVSAGYRDVKKQIAYAAGKVEELAESHYKAGVQYFVNQNLDQAVTEWERTLKLNPDHPNAGKDLAKARKLIEELQKIK